MSNVMNPLQNVGRSAMRMAKNYTKGYSDIQTKVREATSNDPWGPSGSQMNELAQATYNQQDFIEIMEMLDKRLNDKGKNWRHVFKALTVLDYILHAGSENVVLYFQENIYVVKTLREFVYVDEDGKDQGSNVRQKAKDITNLLMDDSRIREQRRTRSNMRDRMSGYKARDRDSDDSEDERHRRSRATPPGRRQTNAEDDELARAIEESKRMARLEQDKNNRNRQADNDLEEAMRLSREEEERRKRMLAGNDGSLFDQDNPKNNENGPNFGWDNLIDMNSNPTPQQQMPQPTGMAFGSFNPYAAQLQQQQQQEEFARMQQQMEMQRQMELQAQMQAQAEQDAYNQMLAQQAYLQQQQQQQQLLMQQQQPQPLVPQHTSIGSNNPFAAFSKPASPPPPMPVQAPSSGTATPPALATRPQAKPKDDGKYAHLAGLLGNRDDGIDTFGNYGQLRYGTSRAPGTNPFQKDTASQPAQQQQQPSNNQQPFFEI